jgi:hypothetical protein
MDCAGLQLHAQLLSCQPAQRDHFAAFGDPFAIEQTSAASDAANPWAKSPMTIRRVNASRFPKKNARPHQWCSTVQRFQNNAGR